MLRSTDAYRFRGQTERFSVFRSILKCGDLIRPQDNQIV